MKRRVKKSTQWYGAGQRVSVHGYDIPGGLIYVGENPPDPYGFGLHDLLTSFERYSMLGDYDSDPSLISRKLEVSPGEPSDNMGLDYYPHYTYIPPECRGAYLKWLAGGRSEPKAYIGYVFLFFYGLERRLFIDGQKGEIPEEERDDMVNEVRRLLDIYGGNRSFREHVNNFLAMEWVLYRSEQSAPDYFDFSDTYSSEPFQLFLARHVVKGKPIPAEMALHWARLHPRVNLRIPARRCAEEFRKLFSLRYRQQFGDGLLVKPNMRQLELEYQGASPSIWVELEVPDLPDPFILPVPVKKLGALTEACTVELEPLSRFLGRKGNAPNSLAALALLPREIMNETPAFQNARDCLAQHCTEEPKLRSMEDIYACFGEKAPPKIGKKESENLAVMMERLGFGIVPDVRFHNIKPTPDGKVVIFRYRKDKDSDEDGACTESQPASVLAQGANRFLHGYGADFRPSKAFRTVIAILRLGAMVSQIDQDISPAGKAIRQALIRDNRGLNRMEQDSLLAFLHWCLHTPQGTAGLKQTLSEFTTAEKTAIGHILISVAHVDGRIDPKKIKQLEKLYVMLGLDKNQVANDLHSLAATSGPVTVGLRDPETGFSIPQPKGKTDVSQGLQLNEDLIRIREEETRQVKGVLESIFSDETEEPKAADVPPTADTPSSGPLAALDSAHRDLFHRLLTKETWERGEVQGICQELGLMTDGALEVLNEWAFEHADAPLIEDGDPVYVDIELAEEITDGEG